MAETTSDRRVVVVKVTRAEMAQLLGSKAKEAGLIDFDPDRTQIIDNGSTGFDIQFDKDTEVVPV